MISPSLMPLYVVGALLLLVYPDVARALIGLYLGLLIWRHF